MNQSPPLSGEHIVCISSASWDAMWVNAQHLMSRLARHNKVLYVNNMGLRPPGASRSDLAKIRNRLAEWMRPASEELPGCWVLSPVVIPFHKYAAIRRLNQFLLKWVVKRWMTKLDIENPILWIFLPTGLPLVGRLGEKGVVYYCVDDYANNPNVPADLIREMENRLLARADIAFTTSPKLYEDRQGKAGRLFLTPNTADVARFRDYSGTLPAGLKRIKDENPDAKIIGYQGNIAGYKTDLRLLEKIAENFPEHCLVLVGPAGWGDPSTDIGRLEKMPNVYFTGRVDYGELPGWIHGFDVCLIPMNINESTKGSFPMKFYEYMACSKPIVATALPAFEGYRDCPEFVRLADDHDEFIGGVKDAVENPGTESVRAARAEEASENDWEARVKLIGEKVAEVIKEKGN